MARSFRYGVNITGYDHDGRTFPRLAFLCPHCAEGEDDFWRNEAETGDVLDCLEWELAALLGLRCESCGVPARNWRVPM